MLKKCISSIGVGILLATLAFGQETDIKPKMNSAGKISIGSKSIWIKDEYCQIDMIIDDTVSLFGSGHFNFGNGDTSPCFLPNTKHGKRK